MSNTLFYDDNLVVLRNREHFPDQSVDLIYLGRALQQQHQLQRPIQTADWQGFEKPEGDQQELAVEAAFDFEPLSTGGRPSEMPVIRNSQGTIFHPIMGFIYELDPAFGSAYITSLGWRRACCSASTPLRN